MNDDERYSEIEDDDFLSEELVIAALLAYLISINAESTIDDVIAALKRGERLDGVLAIANTKYSALFDDDTAEKVRKSLIKEIKKGAELAGGYALVENLLLTDEILDGMVRSAKYYTNNYFNRFVMPTLYDLVNNYAGIGELDDKAYTAIRQKMESRLINSPYWRIVANAATSRSYHYGLLKAASVTGRTGYRFVAVMDRRTSAICQEMNGRVFWIQDAMQVMERVAQVGTTEEIKEITPWVSAEAVRNVSSEDLSSMGVLVPPLHANCRSTIVPTSDY